MAPDQMFLYHEFWNLTQEIIFEGVPIALQKAYEGKLGRGAMINLLQRTSRLKKYEISTTVEIDYGKISKGIDLREEMMKSGEITEDNSGTFILPEELNEMSPEARELYYRIERLEDRCEAWNNRRIFISFMQNEDVNRYDIRRFCIISFDDELLKMFFEAYRCGENGYRRELVLTLKDFVYTDKGVSSTEDVKVTITNFNKLKTMIQKLLDSEQDAFARVIISETLNALAEFQETIKDVS